MKKNKKLSLYEIINDNDNLLLEQPNNIFKRVLKNIEKINLGQSIANNFKNFDINTFNKTEFRNSFLDFKTNLDDYINTFRNISDSDIKNITKVNSINLSKNYQSIIDSINQLKKYTNKEDLLTKINNLSKNLEKIHFDSINRIGYIDEFNNIVRNSKTLDVNQIFELFNENISNLDSIGVYNKIIDILRKYDETIPEIETFFIDYFKKYDSNIEKMDDVQIYLQKNVDEIDNIIGGLKNYKKLNTSKLGNEAYLKGLTKILDKIFPKGYQFFIDGKNKLKVVGNYTLKPLGWTLFFPYKLYSKTDLANKQFRDMNWKEIVKVFTTWSVAGTATISWDLFITYQLLCDNTELKTLFSDQEKSEIEKNLGDVIDSGENGFVPFKDTVLKNIVLCTHKILGFISSSFDIEKQKQTLSNLLAASVLISLQKMCIKKTLGSACDCGCGSNEEINGKINEGAISSESMKSFLGDIAGKTIKAIKQIPYIKYVIPNLDNINNEEDLKIELSKYFKENLVEEKDGELIMDGRITKPSEKLINNLQKNYPKFYGTTDLPFKKVSGEDGEYYLLNLTKLGKYYCELNTVNCIIPKLQELTYNPQEIKIDANMDINAIDVEITKLENLVAIIQSNPKYIKNTCQEDSNLPGYIVQNVLENKELCNLSNEEYISVVKRVIFSLENLKNKKEKQKSGIEVTTEEVKKPTFKEFIENYDKTNYQDFGACDSLVDMKVEDFKEWYSDSYGSFNLPKYPDYNVNEVVDDGGYELLFNDLKKYCNINENITDTKLNEEIERIKSLFGNDNLYGNNIL
jgi:hypothetical protein